MGIPICENGLESESTAHIPDNNQRLTITYTHFLGESHTQISIIKLGRFVTYWFMYNKKLLKCYKSNS